MPGPVYLKSTYRRQLSSLKKPFITVGWCRRHVTYPLLNSSFQLHCETYPHQFLGYNFLFFFIFFNLYILQRGGNFCSVNSLHAGSCSLLFLQLHCWVILAPCSNSGYCCLAVFITISWCLWLLIEKLQHRPQSYCGLSNTFHLWGYEVVGISTVLLIPIITIYYNVEVIRALQSKIFCTFVSMRVQRY